MMATATSSTLPAQLQHLCASARPHFALSRLTALPSPLAGRASTSPASPTASCRTATVRRSSGYSARPSSTSTRLTSPLVALFITSRPTASTSWAHPALLLLLPSRRRSTSGSSKIRCRARPRRHRSDADLASAASRAATLTSPRRARRRACSRLSFAACWGSGRPTRRLTCDACRSSATRPATSACRQQPTAETTRRGRAAPRRP